MKSRIIVLIAVLSLLAGVVRFPLPAAAAVKAAEHSQHHCCPKPAQMLTAALVAPVSSLPCGASHSCCAVRAPAKLPSLAAGSGNKGDSQLAHTTNVSSPPSRQKFAAATSLAPNVVALELSTVLRI